MNNGCDDARCGSGVWVADGSPYNRAFRVPGPFQSNQVGEIVAIILALQSIPPMTPLSIHSDSRYVIDGLTAHLATWEDKGWIDVSNAVFFATAAFLLRRRSAPTTFTWVKGHNGDVGNEHADRLADAGARKPHPDILDLSIDPAFRLSGAKLSTLTQALAYRGIRAARDKPLRRSTVRNIYAVRDAIHTSLGSLATIPSVWTSCRHRDIPRPIQQFLFRSLHHSYKIGAYWESIPGYEHRASCSACGAPTESMDHLLFQCPDSHQALIWHLARDLWPHGADSWPDMNIGTALACGLLSVRTPDDTQPPRPRPGPTRLLRILVAESVHLIWVLRCEATIAERTLSPAAVVTRWRRRLHDRLITDKINASRTDRRPASSGLVRSTWRGVLLREDELPPDWVTDQEVLVGIKPSNPLLTGPL
ncbi:RnaseH-domain-containing protein [Auriscalpium vulgare]|uniref:RnaseH-domain-containing protein n=1 Tax=Auriscalpium vulgare TaxID=40419 RepID=A0ACB8R791_9AGAM|nr:RnaseH-domain-containing protein [Auriscalpium vulgare]